MEYVCFWATSGGGGGKRTKPNGIKREVMPNPKRKED